MRVLLAAARRAVLGIALVAVAGCSDPPKLSSISPSSGPLAGGTVVSVFGTNFDHRARLVIAGNICQTVAFTGSGAFTATTPPGPAVGSWTVEVINGDGQRDKIRGGFTYTSGVTNPTITAVTPPGGSAGTTVTITGTGFQSNATVQFAATAATNVSEAGGTTITCTAPQGPGGLVSVTVTNQDGGTATRASAYNYNGPGGATTGSTSGSIATIAGSATKGFSGDGGQATAALFSGPSGLAVAPDSSLYVADTGNNRIRQIATSGAVATVAGGSAAGFASGAATTAGLLSGPQGLAVDSQGTLYIADTGNHAIRQLAGGQLTTLAGHGAAGSAGDGGVAALASLSSPRAVAVDAARNVFIADTGNNRIRRIDASAGTIASFAGTGAAGFGGDGGAATSAQLSGPAGIVIDASSGTVYVADTGNNRVRKIDGSLTIATFAGTGTAGFAGDGGPATAAELDGPTGLALDSARTLYICDTQNERVRSVPAATLSIATFAGNGTAGFSGDGGLAAAASLNAPVAVAATTTAIDIADSGDGSVRQVH